MHDPAQLATGFQMIAWSLIAPFGVLFPICMPPLLALMAFGVICRVRAVMAFGRARLDQVPVIASHLDWLNGIVITEFLVIITFGLYVFSRDGSFFEDGFFSDAGIAFFLWLWLMVMTAAALAAASIGRSVARRCRHELVLLQLRTACRCIVAAYVTGAAAACAAYWFFGSRDMVLWSGLAAHGVVAMLAAAHGMASFGRLARYMREGT